MNDGGGDTRKDTTHNTNNNDNNTAPITRRHHAPVIAKKKSNSGKDDFVQSIARIAVAQICESAGFQTFNQTALNTLSDVAVRYICDVGKTANMFANLAGRNECNVFDIIQGLEDLGSVQGFSGASDVNHCLSGSGVVKDLVRFLGESEEVPFAYSIPGFPVTKERNLNPSFIQKGQSPPAEHIPAWLPAFPALETHANLSPGTENEATETRVDKEAERVEAEQGKTERPLLNLQQRLACNGPEMALAVEPGDAAKAKRAAESNPFLAAPLRSGEKAVCPIVLPTKLLGETLTLHQQNRVTLENHVSLMETFAPAIEAVKTGQQDAEEHVKNVLIDKRSSLKFKFGSGRKSSSAVRNLHSESIDRVAYWFGNDNGKDDRKRRAEEILKSSMEYPQELPHL